MYSCFRREQLDNCQLMHATVQSTWQFVVMTAGPIYFLQSLLLTTKNRLTVIQVHNWIFPIVSAVPQIQSNQSIVCFMHYSAIIHFHAHERTYLTHLYFRHVYLTQSQSSTRIINTSQGRTITSPPINKICPCCIKPVALTTL